MAVLARDCRAYQVLNGVACPRVPYEPGFPNPASRAKTVFRFGRPRQIVPMAGRGEGTTIGTSFLTFFATIAPSKRYESSSPAYGTEGVAEVGKEAGLHRRKSH